MTGKELLQGSGWMFYGESARDEFAAKIDVWLANERLLTVRRMRDQFERLYGRPLAHEMINAGLCTPSSSECGPFGPKCKCWERDGGVSEGPWLHKTHFGQGNAIYTYLDRNQVACQWCGEKRVTA